MTEQINELAPIVVVALDYSDRALTCNTCPLSLMIQA